MSAVLAPVARAARGLGWFLRQVTGEFHWDDYLAQCVRDGSTPMTRRAFERHRAEHRERNVQGRCC